MIQGDGAGALGKQYDAVNNSLAQANAARQAQYKAAQNEFATNTWTPEDLQKTGLFAGQGVYNINLNDPKYLTQNADLTKDQSMTPEQRSYIQALSKLSGVTDTFASGAAQSPTDAYTINSDLLKNDIASRGSQYQTDGSSLEKLKGNLNDLNSQLAQVQLNQSQAKVPLPGSLPYNYQIDSLQKQIADLGAQISANESAISSQYSPTRTINNVGPKAVGPGPRRLV